MLPTILKNNPSNPVCGLGLWCWLSPSSIVGVQSVPQSSKTTPPTLFVGWVSGVGCHLPQLWVSEVSSKQPVGRRLLGILEVRRDKIMVFRLKARSPSPSPYPSPSQTCLPPLINMTRRKSEKQVVVFRSQFVLLTLQNCKVPTCSE